MSAPRTQRNSTFGKCELDHRRHNAFSGVLACGRRTSCGARFDPARGETFTVINYYVDKLNE